MWKREELFSKTNRRKEKTPVDYKTKSEIGLITTIYTEDDFFAKNKFFEIAFTKLARNQWDALFPNAFFAQYVDNSPA